MSKIRKDARCACGRPLHYPCARIRDWVCAQIERDGPTVPVETPEGTFIVPRHFAVLHHVFNRLDMVPVWAKQYGFPRIDSAQAH